MSNKNRPGHIESSKSMTAVLEEKISEELWEINKKFFIEYKEQFKAKYLGLYVAVHDGKVLGAHEEIGQLVGSLYEQYGNIPLYADKVGEKAIRAIN